MGCGPKQSAGAAKCEAVVQPAEARFEKHEQAVNPNFTTTPEISAAVVNVLVDSCKGDGWDPKMIACVEAANDNDALFSCMTNLTPDQATGLRNKLRAELHKRLLKALPPGIH
jgi:hypothetical protein